MTEEFIDPLPALRAEVDQHKATMLDVMPAVAGVMQASIEAGFTRAEAFQLARDWFLLALQSAGGET